MKQLGSGLRARKQRGVIIVWFALCLILLLLFVGLALDTANVKLTGHQLQNAADASALAGAQRVWGSDDPNESSSWQAVRQGQVRTLAKTIAASNRAGENPVALSDAMVELGHYYRPGNPEGQPVGFVTGASAWAHPFNAVRVTTGAGPGQSNPSVPLIFGSMVGVNSSTIQHQAVAMVSTTKAGIIVLDPKSPSSLWFHGSAAFALTGGSVMVNSTSGSAMNISGSSGTVSAPEFDVAGNYVTSGQPTINGSIQTGQYPLADPLQDLPMPAATGGAQNGPDKNNEFWPGVYNKAIKLSGQGNYVFQPGIYELDGGISISGGPTVTANGVLFYVKGGDVHITGGTVVVTPPTSGVYTGISFFQDPSNTSSAKFAGNQGSQLLGTLYFPKAAVELEGTGTTLTNQVIVWQLEVGGNMSMNINYQGGNPAPGRVYLVQ